MANHSITVYGNNAGTLFDGIVLYDTVEFNVIESIKSTYSGIFTVEFSGFVLVEKKDISVIDGESNFTIVFDTYALRRAFAIVPENGKRTLVCRLLNPQSGRIGAEFFVKIQNYTKRVEDFSPADKEKLDNLKDIAFTGDYGDLLNTPEIPQDYIRSVNGKTDSDIVLTHNDVGAEVAGSVSDHNGSVSAHEILFSEVELNLNNHNESSDSHNELFAQKTNVDTTAAIEARVAELEEKAEGDTHGTVTSVNDIEPDGDGNVSIAASDILTDTGNTIEENLNTRATTLETDEIKERVSALEEKEIPTDISDLTDTNNKVQTTAESKVSEHNNNNDAHSTLFLNKANAIHSHVVSDISDFPEIPDVPDIPADISDLTDNTNVIGTKAEEVADNKVSGHNNSLDAHFMLFTRKANVVHTHVVTDITDFPEIPTDISDLTDTTSIVANTANNKVRGHNEASDAHSGLFAGKANAVHTHVVADVTDFPTIPSTSDIEGIASGKVAEHNNSESAHPELFSEKADTSALANYLPLTGGNITGELTVGDNPVTALPAGTVAGTLYVGANRELTTFAAALDHIRQSSNGLDKLWNIRLDPGEYSISGTITGLRLNIAPVSGSYSTDCRIVGIFTFQDSNITLANMHIGAESLSSGIASILVNCGYFVAQNCVFYAGANTGGYTLRFAYCASGTLRGCRFYAPTTTTSGSVTSLQCHYNSFVYLTGNENAFIGTSGVTGMYAIWARSNSCVYLYGQASVTNYSVGIWCIERSCCFGQSGSFTFSGVTTNSSPADGTTGNDNSYVNI